VEHRYTRNEVERMMGVTRRELDYWTRLRLVLPRSRWGERFFNFSDLVALETIKRLAAPKGSCKAHTPSCDNPPNRIGNSGNSAFKVAHFNKRQAGSRVSTG